MSHLFIDKLEPLFSDGVIEVTIGNNGMINIGLNGDDYLALSPIHVVELIKLLKEQLAEYKIDMKAVGRKND